MAMEHSPAFTAFPLPAGLAFNGTMGEGSDTIALFTDLAEGSVSHGATVALLQLGLTAAALDSRLQAKRREFLAAAAIDVFAPPSPVSALRSPVSA